MKVNRQQLFKCFNALGNLAEKTGELSLKIETQTKEGIDASWLKNAVEEPIEEASVEIKERKNETAEQNASSLSWLALTSLGRLTRCMKWHFNEEINEKLC